MRGALGGVQRPSVRRMYTHAQGVHAINHHVRRTIVCLGFEEQFFNIRVYAALLMSRVGAEIDR